uniref:Fibronectin type-III domain-containing protein n=1 Tax=Candidatus Kentrum sp. FW TaxID=2126338 RepID=A0A450U083_9GAMM|nr:MAG: hypothetical protein BECKFW1821C_GA0114237_10863 [Candidatus Kentron sp. FW]
MSLSSKVAPFVLYRNNASARIPFNWIPRRHHLGIKGIQLRQRVATYRIQRREAGAGPWTLVEIAMETEARVVDQARGAVLEFCVVASNKAGEGEASNTVTVSL